MILLVFRRKKLWSVLVFDLTSFPDKIYHWREALKRRNFDTSAFYGMVTRYFCGIRTNMSRCGGESRRLGQW
jgi:hypothetical protein